MTHIQSDHVQKTLKEQLSPNKYKYETIMDLNS